MGILEQSGPQPRYVIACELVRRSRPTITLESALDYINAASNEGLLEHIGTMVHLKGKA